MSQSCGPHNAHLFDFTSVKDAAAIHEALAICEGCPVIETCRQAAIDRPPEGIQVIGGLLFADLRRSRAPRRPHEHPPWSTAEIRAAHAAYFRGVRTADVVAGEREYQRSRKRAGRAQEAIAS